MLTFFTHVIRFLQQGKNPRAINIFLDHGRDMGSSALDVMHWANNFEIVDSSPVCSLHSSMKLRGHLPALQTRHCLRLNDDDSSTQLHSVRQGNSMEVLGLDLMNAMVMWLLLWWHISINYSSDIDGQIMQPQKLQRSCHLSWRCALLFVFYPQGGRMDEVVLNTSWPPKLEWKNLHKVFPFEVSS